MTYEALKILALIPSSSYVWDLMRSRYEIIHIEIKQDYLLAPGSALGGPSAIRGQGGI